ncbi:RecB family exonuclease [Patescibacteria group bacterium]
MRVSYSALNTFKTCPLKFKYQVLDKLKTSKSIEAIFGTVIHSVLKNMFVSSPLFPTTDELLDNFNNVWHKKTTHLTDSDKEKSEAYFKEGIEMIKNFYKKNPPWNFNVVELESRFEVPVENPKTNEVHILSGIIDRVDKDPNNSIYEIIDYKTSKRMPSAELLDRDLQLSIYNMGLTKKWPHLKPDNIKLSLYFLKHNEKIETKRTEEDIKNTTTEVLVIIDEVQDIIRSKNEFTPTPSALCDWCGYRNICPMWKHLYRVDTPKISENDAVSALEQYLEIKDTNKQNSTRLKALQAVISDFMDKEGIERLFTKNAYITRLLQERTSYKMPEIRKILEELGKWDEMQKKTKFTTLKVSKIKVSRNHK